MVDEGLQNLFQVHHARRQAAVEHVHVQRKTCFKVGIFVKLRHQQFSLDGFILRRQHDAHIFGRFVRDVVEERQLFVYNQLGNLLDKARFDDLIGNFGDNDLPAVAFFRLFLVPDRAHAQRTAAGFIRLTDDGLVFGQNAARRKIRPLDEFQQVFDFAFLVLDKKVERVAKLRHVMRRDVGRHTDRDTGRAVRQQVGEIRGHNHRFDRFAVVGRAEVDGILVDVFQKQLGDLGQARFGISHRGGVIAIDVAEVALPVHQRIAHGKILRQTHHGIINGAVAMRVIFTDDVTHNTRRFFGRRFRLQVQLIHGIEHTAMHRLQPVAHVGQRARHDGRERVGKIFLAQNLAQLAVLDIHRDDGIVTA